MKTNWSSLIPTMVLAALVGGILGVVVPDRGISLMLSILSGLLIGFLGNLISPYFEF